MNKITFNDNYFWSKMEEKKQLNMNTNKYVQDITVCEELNSRENKKRDRETFTTSC